MSSIGFYIGGVSASVLGATDDSRFGQIVVGTMGSNNTFSYTSVCEVKSHGDTGYGKLNNKILSYGWMSCNTERHGVRLSADNSGRIIPFNLSGKHIEIEVDSGATFSGYERVNTKIKIQDLDGNGQKGNVLYDYDGLLRIWSGRMSSDAKISGILMALNGDQARAVAEQVINNAAQNL